MVSRHAAVAMAIVLLLYAGLIVIASGIPRLRQRIRAARTRALERELQRKEMELRQEFLNLTSQLGANAHEARRALIRVSFLASQDKHPLD